MKVGGSIMKGIKETILSKIKKTPAPPFLFIGSGISQRYAGAPTWEGLLRHFSELANTDELGYEMYADEANRNRCENGLEPKIAELIEADFNKKWFKDDNYKENREKYGYLIKNKCSPFKVEIAEFFNSMSEEEFIKEMTGEIELLKKVGDRSIAGVITTNYDCIIEKIFTNYKYSKYIGQEELLFSPITGISEIYKIHGCCTSHKSIVINNSDYERFNERNAYLVAKLLTIFLEHPMVFIGYKIGDSNIKEILTSIAKCLSKENLEKLKDRFIFIEWNNSSNDDSISNYEFSNLGDDKSISMTKVSINDFSILYEALLENKVTYNPRLIKKLKKDIYNIVLDSEPTESIKVLLDIDDDRLDEVETVVGFGVMQKLGYKGYDGLDVIDLFNDVIFDSGYEGGPLDNNRVVETALPKILKHNQSIPMNKYLKDYDEPYDANITKYLKTTYKEYLDNAIRNDLDKGKVKERSIRELKEKYDLLDCIKYIPRLKKEYIDIEELHSFIVEFMGKYPDKLAKGTPYEKTGLRRLIKIYDFLKYSK